MCQRRKKKRTYAISMFMVWMITLLFISPNQITANHNETHPPEVSAHAAALIDVESGRILYAKNGDEQMLVASLTKIMTAIVAIEHGNLADIVTAGKNAVGKEGSSIYLQHGEQMTLEHMLYGLMLRSGNDAATAIAEHVGGSIEGFVFLMNEKAEQLGLQHTNFENPHGLDGKDHRSTAVDLARLTAYALKNATFQEIVKTKVKNVPNPHDEWDYRWRNKNKMLHMYDGADGVKTGYTKQAGRCLVSSASRDGQQLVVVTLKASSDWHDHARLLDFGFAHFPMHSIVEKGKGVKQSGYTALRSFRYPITEQERSQLTLHIQPLRKEEIDYQLGVHGYAQIELDGVSIGNVPLEISGEASVSESRMRIAKDRTSARWEWTDAVVTVFQSLFTKVM